VTADDLRRIGAKWTRARDVERAAAEATYAAIVAAIADGMSESEAARVAGVDRMTVRRALGKR
jgi:DNA invertase Pin-like site-specific DNA recombinase